MLEQFIEITAALKIPTSEIKFLTSRSGGPGGQNVNKVETRVELRFDLANSTSVNESTKQRLLSKIPPSVMSDGVIKITSQESRSQWQNKQIAVDKFITLFQKALRPDKKRIKTKATHSSTLQRLESKRKRSTVKQQRRRPLNDE